MRILISLIFLLFISFGILLAHGDEKHEKKKEQSTQDPTRVDKSGNNRTTIGELNLSIKNFPTLHPLVVHFPIVLLLLAPLFQLLALFFSNREFSIAALLITIFGFIGAWLASTSFHPHTIGLTEEAKSVLERHEYFASIVLWSAGIAVVMKLASHFLFKRKLATEILVLMVMVVAAVAVSISGHHGAQLTHLHGVGPQGKYLKQQH